MAQEVILYFSLMIGIAAVLTVIGKAIRQPPIIAYLITGIIVGPMFFGLIGPNTAHAEIVQTFAHIGVALLLFIVGLSLDFRVLKEVGAISAFAGIGEITLTAAIGFLIALGLGFSYTPALYLAAALAFSSTVLVVKILSDKKEMDTLHARIALGILIVEDFVAAVLLMIIPTLQNGNLNTVFLDLGKIIILIIVIFLFSMIAIKRLMPYLAKSQEVLFLFGVAWALMLASLFSYLGFSLEIGALIAGMSLASSKYTLELGGKIKPLRDFFIVLFFVFFGSQLVGNITWKLIGEALLFSAFIVIGKPIIVMSIMRFFGYKKKVNFLTGASIAQISEFSLILILLGYSLGHIPQELMSLAIIIAVITIGISSYSIYYSHYIFNKMSHLLNLFEGKKDEINNKNREKYDAILFGYHRIGYKVLEELKNLKMKTLVVDYNPRVVMDLSKKKVDCIYGDASNKEFLAEIKLNEAKLIISTVPDLESNRIIMEHLRETEAKAIFITTSEQPREALELYSEGVDYVIIPQHLGGEYVAYMIDKFGTNLERYKDAGKKHAHELKQKKNNSTFR